MLGANYLGAPYLGQAYDEPPLKGIGTGTITVTGTATYQVMRPAPLP